MHSSTVKTPPWILRSNVGDLAFAPLFDVLKATSRPIAEVTIPDLISPLPSASNGLYFFFDCATLLYIGAARSRSLVERIPAHFDPRQSAWFNVLPKRLVERAGVPDLPRAVQMACTFRLAMILDDSGRNDVLDIETVLRHVFAPTLNGHRRRRKYSGSINDHGQLI